MAARAATKKKPRDEATGLPGPVHVLHGAEPFLIREHTDAIAGALRAYHGGLDVFVYDGASAAPATILDELRTFGLLAAHKLVIVDAADELLKASSGDDENDGAAKPAGRPARQLFEDYVAHPCDGATLVLRAGTWRKGKIDKAIAAVGGAIVKCDPLKDRDAVRWCADRCRARLDCTIDSAAASGLVGLVGAGLGRLDSELSKLAALVGPGRTITMDDVRGMVGLSREEKAWIIQSALVSGSVEQSLRKLRELIDVTRAPEELIVWSMLDLVRRLHAAARMLRDGMPPGAVISRLRIFADRDRMIDVARRTGPAPLAALHRRVIDADRQRKTGGARNSTRALEVLALDIADTIKRSAA